MNILKKIAASLAFFLGALSVFAGSRVLLGIDVKEYNVLIWLVSYNVVFGFISVLAAYLIWKKMEMAKNLTLFILTMHFLVLVYLKFFSDTVAQESIKAMLFRTSIWIIITVISILIPKYIQKNSHRT
ncbi:MAG TPA: hypothetical protein ENK46_05480 [Flavobacteriia bacterium]|nr:hypothetical protein [Flavobacteriia bacterium]